MPSPVDAKSLRDLDVMKSCHDVASVMTKESLELIWERYSILEEYVLRDMDLLALHGMPKVSGDRTTTAARASRSSLEIEEIRVEATPKRLAEPAISSEDDSPLAYSRPKLMKDLCDTRVHKDDEGYYVLHIMDSTPKNLDSVMRARWPNLTYSAKVWDNSQVALEFGRGVLHSNLAKGLYTLPFEVLMAQAAKQIVLETDLEVAVVSRPLLDRSPGVCLACRGVVASGDLSTHNDINLFFNWLCWVRLMILVRTPFGVDSLVLDITTEVSLMD
ncbi:hypothetical protein B296_00030188 [Ensete ventricosum]|uniref:Uncharacterized protein n=1 Tax=Ensete ventricosum TaxID=4639 RepID=A0A426YZJ6_ENSVE|nr:hypothetical protein B296_00030188 [Ensete ventricosum]